MKSIVVISAFTLLAAVAWCGEDPEVGDSVERVQELMGASKGHLKAGEMQVLIFERGRVEIREGLVTAVSLVSEAELEQVRRERERAWAARQEQMRQRRRERLEIAERLRLSMLVDDELHAKPVSEQLEVWRAFQRSYPEIDVSEKITALLDVYESQRREREVAQRLAEMERRVEEAERRARMAEEQAARSSWTVYHRQPESYYYSPVPRVHIPHRRDVDPRKSDKPAQRTVYTALPYPLRTPPSAISPARQRLYKGYGGTDIEDWENQ